MAGGRPLGRTAPVENRAGAGARGREPLAACGVPAGRLPSTPASDRRPYPGTGQNTNRRGALPAPEARARGAFRLALLRDPDAEELAQGVAFLKAHADKPAEAAGQLL